MTTMLATPSKLRKGALKKKTISLLSNLLLIAFSVTCIYPIFWMLYSSFKTSTEFSRSIIALPTSLHFENYVTAFRMGKIGLYSMNSMFNAVISCAVLAVFAFVTGYFIARFNFRCKKAMYITYMFGMLVPIHALLVPVFIQYKNFGLFDKRYTLLIPYIAFALPFSIFLVEGFIKKVPRALEEAAMIDGSSFTRTMFSIIMPVCKPVLLTITMLCFLDSWNEYPFALVLIKSNSLKTLPLGLLNFNGQYSKEYTVQMAGLVMSIIPIIILYAFMNKQIIEGMTAGAVKE